MVQPCRRKEICSHPVPIPSMEPSAPSRSDSHSQAQISSLDRERSLSKMGVKNPRPLLGKNSSACKTNAIFLARGRCTWEGEGDQAGLDASVSGQPTGSSSQLGAQRQWPSVINSKWKILKAFWWFCHPHLSKQTKPWTGFLDKVAFDWWAEVSGVCTRDLYSSKCYICSLQSNAFF